VVDQVNEATLTYALNYVEKDNIESFKRLYREQKETILTHCTNPDDDSNILMKALSRQGKNKVAMFLLNQREIIELIGFVKPQETDESTRLTFMCVDAIVENKNGTLIVELVEKSLTAIRSISSDAGHFVTLFLLHVIGMRNCHYESTHCKQLELYFSRLMIAARVGDVEQVKQLIYGDGGKELINKRCAEGLTALHFAACYGHTQVVDVLLKAGADIRSYSSELVSSPIEFATVAGHFDTAVTLWSKFNEKLNSKKNIDDMTGNEKLELRAIWLNVLHVASAKGCNRFIDQLIDQYDVCKQWLKEKNEKGYTALMVAARAGQVETVKHLLSRGGNWDETDDDDSAILHYATQSGQTAVVQFLVNYVQGFTETHLRNNGKENANRYGDGLSYLLIRRDVNGLTAAQVAAVGRRYDTALLLVQLMLECAERFMEVDELNYMLLLHALHAAAAAGFCDKIDAILHRNVKLLHKNSEGMTALMFAAQTGQVLTVKHLLSRPEANWMDHEYVHELSTAIQYATNQGHTNVVEAMVKFVEDAVGRDGDSQERRRAYVVTLMGNDESKWSAVFSAARRGGAETTRVLMKRLDVLYEGCNGDELMDYQVVKLHAAAAVGCDDIIEQVTIEIGQSNVVKIVNKKDGDGRTALIFAANAGHSSTVELLLSAGASVMVTDKTKSTALHYAAEAGHINIVRTIINFIKRDTICKIEADSKLSDLLMRRDLNGNTAAQSAAMNGQKQAVDVLLAAMVKMTARGTSKSREMLMINALHTAAFIGCNGIINKIIDSNYQLLNEKDVRGRTALMFAANAGKAPTIELLLKGGSSLLVKDFDKWTALHYAARDGHTAAVKILLDCAARNDSRNRGESKADIDLVRFIAAMDKWSRTASYWAAKYGYRQTADVLIKYVDQAMKLSDLLPSALFASAAGGYNDVIEQMKTENRGTNIFNVKDTRGRTGLMIASDRGWASTVKLLLESGAKWTGKDRCLFTALHYAAEAGRIQVVEQIIEYVKREKPATDAKGRNRQLMNLMHRNCYKRTAVQLAAKRGHKRTVRALLDAMLEVSSDVNALGQEMEDVFKNALHAAAAAGFNDIVDIAIGLSDMEIVHAKDADNRNALMFAAETGQTETVSKLLALGSRCTDKDNNDWTPLHYAASHGHHAVVMTIVDRCVPEERANLVAMQDKLHRSAAYYAAKNNHKVTAKYLKEIDANESAVFCCEDGVNGQTALIVATEAGPAETFELLIKRAYTRECECECQDHKPETVLVILNSHDTDIVKLLEKKDKNGYTAKTLQDAMTNYKQKSMKQVANALREAAAGGKEVNHIIEKYNEDIVNGTDAKGRTALMLAAEAGHVNTVNQLLEANARRDDKDYEGKTLLHYAAEAGQSNVIKHLQDISEFTKLFTATNNNGDNALQSAASKGHIATVQMLLTYAFNQCSRPMFRECSRQALRSAIISSKIHCVVNIINLVEAKYCKYIDDRDSCENRLAALQPIKNITDEIIEELLCVDVKVATFLDIRPLHWASQDYTPNDLVEFLEKMFKTYRSQINLNSVDCSGFTALMYCAGKGKLEGFKWLVRHGADVMKTGIANKTVLSYMIEQCAEQPSLRRDILKIFHFINADENTRPIIDRYEQLECNAPSRAIYNKKMTVLQLAAATGNVEIFGHYISDNDHVYVHGTRSFYLVGPWFIRYLKLIADYCSEDECKRMLRIEAPRQFLKKLTRIRQILLLVVLAFHIIHMSCFSAFIVPTCIDRTTSYPNETTPSRHDPDIAYAAFLAWPALVFSFEIYCFVMYIIFAVRNRQRAVSDIKATMISWIKWRPLHYMEAIEHDQRASHVFTIGFCAMSLFWFAAYRFADYMTYEEVVMVTLIYGWMLTLEFLKGIPVLHAFCLVLKIVFVVDVVRILLLFMFVLIGFTLAIYIYINTDHSSGHIGHPSIDAKGMC